MVDLERVQKLIGSHLSAPADKTRERILLSAKKRILDEGFAKLTIGELCHGLRISKKTFYKYFNDKDDLVRGIMAENFKQFVPAVVKVGDPELPPQERLEALHHFIFDVLAVNVSIPFLRDLQILMPELWELTEDLRRMQAANIAKIIEDGQKTGIYRVDLDPDKIARFLLVVMTRLIDPKTLYDHGLQLEDVARILFSLLEGGLITGPKEEA